MSIFKEIRIAPVICGNERQYIDEVLRSANLSGSPSGPFVQKLEAQFCRYTGAKHAVAVNSGSAAIHASLVAAGLKPRDIVAVTCHTFVATVNAILLCGAVPWLLDIDPTTLQPTEDSIKTAFDKGAKYFIPVHLYGIPAAIPQWLDKSQVIEDAAQGLGCFSQGDHVGTIGIAGAFSLSPSKVVSAAEGGIVLTNDEEVANKVRLIRNHGMSGWNKYHQPGFNYRLSELQAALGVAQFEQLDGFLQARRAVAKVYQSHFNSSIFGTLSVHPATRVSWTKYPLMIPDDFHIDEQSFASHLRNCNIPFESTYRGIHTFDFVQQMLPETHLNCSIASDVLPRVVNLHTGPNLSAEQSVQIAEQIKRIIG
ncbi:TPA: DegT/DnrJ/EryC1/StrS family aminotransferase [Vibrio parahaemolyticus]